MVRDIPPYNLRMSTDLKERLVREAEANKRSLNAEIISRLESTLRYQDTGTRPVVSEPLQEYSAHSESERAALALFRRWGPEKQLALLSLFK